MLQINEYSKMIYSTEGYKRNMVVYVEFDGTNSVQRGVRPAILVQNDIGNTYSGTTIVVPLTTRKKRDLPTHMVLFKEKYKFLKDDSISLAEQVITIDKKAIGDYIGRIDDEDMLGVDRAIGVSLGLIKAQRSVIDISKLQIIKERVEQIQSLDTTIRILLDRNRSLESIEDVLNERQEYIQNLNMLCIKYGVKMETFYSLKAVGAESNDKGRRKAI